MTLRRNLFAALAAMVTAPAPSSASYAARAKEAHDDMLRFFKLHRDQYPSEQIGGQK